MSDYEHDALDAREPEYECACNQKAPEDETYYGIGSTTPPKDYTAVVSVVLMMLIAICGGLSVLSMLDIHLFADLTSTPRVPQLGTPVQFSDSHGILPSGLEDVQDAPDTTLPPDIPLPGNVELHINNIPHGQTIQNGSTAETAPNGETLPAPTEDSKLSWQEVYEKVIPSVVSIICTDGYSTTTGTGVVIDARGYIVTNAHVVEDAAQIHVLLWDSRQISASCLGLDTVSDLAVLYVQADNLIPAEFGDSSLLRVGDDVVAIGDPLGVELRGTMTDGIISAINRDLEINGRTMSLLQTTAALNSGNSGGPLVNCYGQVVGINAMKIGDYASTSGVEGLGFAIPMSTVKTVVEQLAQQGYVAGRPDLGLIGTKVSGFYQHYYRLPSGMLITSVDYNSDAYAKGIREGDILLYLEGERITGPELCQQMINRMEVGQEVSVMIYRGGKEYELTLTLGEDHGMR